jgi:multidrug efflux pump subunit AcrA (membrane-fusion protein)
MSAMQSRQDSAPSGDPDVPGDGADAPTTDLRIAGNSAYASIADGAVIDEQHSEIIGRDGPGYGHGYGPKPSLVKRFGTQARRPVLLVNLVLGALILAGGGFAYASVADTVTSSAATRAGSGIRFPVRVQTVTQTASASGSVASSDVVTANFTTDGTVTAIYVKLGQAVTKGQELARINATAADEQLTTAKDNLTAAEDSLTRARDSDDTTAIDSAQLQVDSAQDAVTSAQAAVDGVVLKAPIGGTIIAQNGTIGASTGSSNSSSGGSAAGSGSGTGGSGSSGSGDGGTGGTGGTGATSSSTSSSSGFIQIANLGRMEVDAALRSRVSCPRGSR